MPTTPTDQHSLAPAEQYLRALWDARLLYLAIVALFVAGAMAVTALTPKTYSSQATLSVRQAPNLTANGLLYDSVTQIPPRDQLLAVTPVLFSRRLSANKTVTLAAQDVGIIDTNTHLDDTDVTKWVATELIEKTDMLSLTVISRRRSSPRSSRNGSWRARSNRAAWRTVRPTRGRCSPPRWSAPKRS